LICGRSGSCLLGQGASRRLNKTKYPEEYEKGRRAAGRVKTQGLRLSGVAGLRGGGRVNP
jgi:hypothetical protein